MRRGLAIALVAVLGSGCVYSLKSLGNEPKRAAAGETVTDDALPDTVDEERQRRRNRRIWAMAAGPLEMAAGALVTYLALYAPSQPSDADSVTEALGDAAKEAAGRALLAGIGMGAITGGIGDLLLGGADWLFPSPFVVTGDDGEPRMLKLEELYDRPPTPVLQLDPAIASIINLRGAGGDLGLGVAHWPSARLRLRYGVDLGYEVAMLDGGRVDPVDAEGKRADLYLGGGPSVRMDLALGRRSYWGRYPGTAITLRAAGRLAWSDHGDRYLGWRAAAGLNLGSGKNLGGLALLLGATQLHGRDRGPVPELSFVYVLRTD